MRLVDDVVHALVCIQLNVCMSASNLFLNPQKAFMFYSTVTPLPYTLYRSWWWHDW